MKTIVLCGSMKLKDRMVEIEERLKNFGFTVLLPDFGEVNDYSTMTESKQFELKNKMILNHFDKIKQGDAILVVNESLKGVDSYIGANSFLEMGLAFSLNKKIFLLNNIPDQPNKVEIGGMLPVSLNGKVEGLI